MTYPCPVDCTERAPHVHRAGLRDLLAPATVITLPWKVLVADNARHGLSGRRIILTQRYRDALNAASILALTQWRKPALKSSVALTVTLYEPDKRRRDIGNYSKLIGDALTRVCFVDDSQIDDLRFVRGGLDRANPRAEIEVSAPRVNEKGVG